jgi:hypothetical protein
MHTDLCIIHYTILALHVSGAICTHHQDEGVCGGALVEALRYKPEGRGFDS